MSTFSTRCGRVSTALKGGNILFRGKKRRLVVGILLFELVLALFLMVSSGLIIPTEPAARPYTVREVAYKMGITP